MLDKEYEQQLEAEAENEGMINVTTSHDVIKKDIKNPVTGKNLVIPSIASSSVDDSFTWEQYDDWVSEGDRKEVYSKPKKDHSKFIQQVEDNLLGSDEIVSYLETNTDVSTVFKNKVKYRELSKDEIVKYLKENL